MNWNGIELPDNPYFQDEDVTIYCADCRDILPLIPDKSIDLVITSPPYDDLRLYGGHGFNFNGLPQLVYRILQDGGCCVWIVGDQTNNGSESGNSFRQALDFIGNGFNLHDTMIYGKNGTSRPDNTRYNQCFEYMFILSKGQPSTVNQIKQDNKYYSNKTRYFTRRMRNGETKSSSYQSYSERVIDNIWFYETGYMKSAKEDYIFEHPAIFPEALANDHIVSWSNPSDIILDPFLGSGTTLVCAKKLGRKAIGIEIEEKYCRIAVERLRQSVMPLNT